MRHRESPAANRASSESVRAGQHKDSADPRQTSVTHHYAEAALLGSMILNRDALAGAASMLAPDEFDRPAHRTLFTTLVELHTEGTPVDQITVNDRLATTGRLDEVGGLGAVFDLTSVEGCPTTSAWATYAGIVKREADGRRQVRDHLDALRKLGVDVREVA